MTKKILIRADSNYSIGSGHVYRSLELANYLSEFFEIFFCTVSDKNIFYKKKINKKINLIFKKKIKNYSNSQENKIIFTLNKYIKFDFLFIDTNFFLFRPNKFIIDQTKKIYQITDIYKNANKDLTIINQNYYKKIYNREKYFLFGPKYSLIKKPTLKLVKKKIKKIYRVCIFFGNSDTKNLTYKLLEILSLNFNNLLFKVILGKDNIYKSKTYEKFKKNQNIKFYEDIKNINLFFSKCDLGIGYPGHAQIERMSIGLPTILFSANNDQKNICKIIHKEQFGIYQSHFDNLNEKEINFKVSIIINNITKINIIRKKLIKNFDGNGFIRIRNHLMSYYEGKL